MKLKIGRNKNKENAAFEEYWDEPDNKAEFSEEEFRRQIKQQVDESGIKGAGRRISRKVKPKSGQTIIRVEDLQKLIEKNGGEIDEDTLISMYVPRRNIKRFAREILRMDRLHLLVYGLIALVMVLFIFAFMQEKMGNFTINLDRLEMFRKGVSISETGDFEHPTARLKASAVENATNISIDDLPKDIDSVQGDHNGKDYMAYTYFVRNAGKEDLGYEATITLDKCAKGAEEAARVAVWHNGERTVYAAPSSSGKPEKGCVNFQSKDVVCQIREKNFLLGNVDKYTVVIWLEGDDPECVDKIIGGTLEFSMRIDAIEENKTSLFAKFVMDIKDTLTGNDAISAAGNDAPDYYNKRNVTWENRRNQ